MNEIIWQENIRYSKVTSLRFARKHLFRMWGLRKSIRLAFKDCTLKYGGLSCMEKMGSTW